MNVYGNEIVELSSANAHDKGPREERRQFMID